MTNEEIDNLVFEAQEGSSAALSSLLSAFGYDEWDKYLGKWYRLLWFGRVDLKDKDTRRFLQMYMKDQTKREKLKYRFHDYSAAQGAIDMASWIQDKVNHYYEEDDLKQELTWLFIDCVKRFKKKKQSIGFVQYIANYYRFRVVWLLRRVFKYDVYNTNRRDPFEDAIDESAWIELTESHFDRFYASELNRDQLGIFWINGRCGTVFRPLSVLERTILRDHYLRKMNDGKIGQTYGFHINTIWKKRQKAIQKLKEEKEKQEGS